MELGRLRSINWSIRHQQQYDLFGGLQNTYDFENRLIQKGGITIGYDGDGNRVTKTVAGVTTKYIVSDVNPTGLHAGRGGVAGNAYKRSYVYGLDLLAQYDSGGSLVGFYGYDGHGSVRYLTNWSGTVTDRYDYDAFGNLHSHTGNSYNNYLYAGEQFDPDLGLYYNRARYLDVRVGRFWGMDTCPVCTFEPGSLHQYLYSHSDPVNYVDPSGELEISLLGVSFTASLSESLDAARTKAEQYLGQKARKAVVCETGKIVVEQALVAGVYIFMTELAGGQIVPYVGSAEDIGQRIAQHVATGKMFETVFHFFEVTGGREVRRIVEQKVINGSNRRCWTTSWCEKPPGYGTRDC